MVFVFVRVIWLFVYLFFVKEGNLSDFYVKGEVILIFFNVFGFGVGIYLVLNFVLII